MKVGTTLDGEDLWQIMDFEGINLTRFDFESEGLKNSFYELHVKEFKGGNLVKNNKIFDGGESDFFKIDTSEVSFDIITKISDAGLKIRLRSDRFALKKKSHFHLRCWAT